MPEESDTQKLLTWALFAIAACSLVWELSHMAAWLQVVTSDARVFYLPWYDELMRVGRLRGISGEYANYTPPTLYLFSIASLLNGLIQPVVLLKLINLPFVLASAFLAFRIALILGANRLRAAAVASVVLVFPEVAQNAFHWGQYDILYTTFLLAMTYALLRKRIPLAMLCFGSALAFKLQAIFIAPALLAMILTGELAWPWLALVPVAYFAWMLPAAIAGRPWFELLTVYRQQSNLFTPLSVDAPNVHFLIQDLIPPGIPLREACHLADLLAVLASAWIVWRYVSAYKKQGRRSLPEDLLLTMALVQLSIPYLLPHMHERYYFAGNLFAALLLASRPRVLISVVLLQAATMAVYHLYFKQDAVGLTVSQFVWPVCAFTTGLLMMVWLFYKQTQTRAAANHTLPTAA